MSTVAFCTREDVASALDIPPSTRANAQIDRCIYSASRAVEGLLHRKFAPTLDTRYFNWPDEQWGTSYRVWLDENELIDVTSVSVAGGVLDPATYLLEPANYGPPYDRLELIRSSASSFGGGDTAQRNIAITGLWGYSDESRLVGTTVGSFDASNDIATAVMPWVGVGSVLQVGSERLICQERNMSTTSRALTADLTASAADDLVHTDGNTILAGEVIMIDSERLFVTDVVGNNLVVKRAWSGTTLAAHTATATIYALRAFTVERGALGTAPATHADGTTWTAWVVPPLVHDLTVGEAIAQYQNEQGGYAVNAGSGDNQRPTVGVGLDGLRKQCWTTYGRKARQRVI